MQVIQSVPINSENNLYIIDVDVDTLVLTYRLGNLPKIQYKEKFEISEDGNTVFVNPYWFSTGFINKFLNLKENETN